ncbi:MAG: hypothetical protein DUD27_04695 [Lachnospiraceae bacterium]|nr:MAG: hypothetical protein DUD27_04695 [Lachnospiraceae bacterium]
MMEAFRSCCRRILAKTKKGLPWVIAAVLVVVILGIGVKVGVEQRAKFIYKDHLNDTAVTVDGEALTFRDLAFYVVYEENLVQKSALVYNQEAPADYWNSHVNGKFITLEARNSVMKMAVHDRILLRKAQSKGVVLTSDEKSRLETRRTDFYEDLYDDQKERLPVSYSVLNDTMEDIAVVEKYQRMLASERNDTYASFDYDGKNYRALKKKHDVEINTKLWNRVSIGRVTLNNAPDYQAAKGRQNYHREGK